MKLSEAMEVGYKILQHSTEYKYIGPELLSASPLGCAIVGRDLATLNWNMTDADCLEYLEVHWPELFVPQFFNLSYANLITRMTQQGFRREDILGLVIAAEEVGVL